MPATAASDNHRPELDGLRALAVVAVVGFHAGVPGLSGGYLGVDIFFVLSGYLIATHSLRRQRAGTFRWLRFLEQRARRIVPALYAMLAFTLPVAVWCMLPDQLDVFGQGLFASAASLNNVLLYLTSGYWHVANEFKPLMHTWSLGIEEQVYVLFPVALLACARRPLATLAAVSAISLAGLAWAEFTVRSNPLHAFLLPHARVAEFVAGALLAAWEQARHERHAMPQRRDAVAGAGMALLLACMATFDSSTPHPGVLTLLPVAGTVLVISASRPETWVGRSLAWRPMVALGLVSYSLYLWHQPVLAFTRLRSEMPPGPGAVALAVATSLLLACASWVTIERFGRERAGTRFIWGMTAGGGLALAAAGLFLHLRPGFMHGGEAPVAGLTSPARQASAAFNEGPREYLGSSLESGPGRRVLVVGNSQARDFINAAKENGFLGRVQLSYADDFPECASDLRPPLRDRVARAEVVIFASMAEHTKCWPANAQLLRAMGVSRVVVIGPKNFGWNVNYLASVDAAARFAYRAPVLPAVLAANASLAARVGPAHFVDQLALLGASGGRVPVFTPGHQLISQDLRHFTREGARHAGKLLFEHPLLRDLR